MRIPRRGEKGFTLIELLIVVAILVILAVIIAPSVIRFLGRGEEEAQNEYNKLFTAVYRMKKDNGLTHIPNPVEGAANRTRDMTAFPDTTSADSDGPDADSDIDKGSDPDENAYNFIAGDKAGYILYGHDIIGDGQATSLVNYVPFTKSEYWYSIDEDFTLHQYDSDGNEITH